MRLLVDRKTLMEREAADNRDPKSCDNLYAFTKDQLGAESESLFPV